MVSEPGKQAVAGQLVGEMWIDVNSQEGIIRIKLRNIQPPEMMAQLVGGFAQVLSTGGTQFGLTVKQYISEGKK